MSVANEVLEGLQAAVDGEFAVVHIAGQKWVRVPDCSGCAAASGGHRPKTMHFHHPGCSERTKCAECGGDISGLSCEHFPQEVGAICAGCAYGDEIDD